MLSANYQRHWPAYFDAVEQQPPRQTLLKALEVCGTCTNPPPHQRIMIDLACGQGRDTLATLSHCNSWRVIAIDSSEDGLARLRRAAELQSVTHRIDFVQTSLEDVPKWWQSHREATPSAPSTVSLINASFALPFCEPAKFPALWHWIHATLAPGGCFAGQIFGSRDSWQPIRPASHYSREAVLELLAPFEIVQLEEVEKDGSDAMGGTKHHHLFHIVARRPEKNA